MAPLTIRLSAAAHGKNAIMRPISRVTPWVFAVLVLAALAGVGLFVRSASQAPVLSKASPAASGRVQDGRFAFRVEHVQRNVPELGDQFYGASPAGTYTVVTLSVRNTGTSTATFDGAYAVGIDRHDHRVTADREATAIANDDGVGRLTQLAPGERITMRVAFDVEPGHRIVEVQVHDSVFSRGAGLRL